MYKFIKRLFDFLIAFTALVVLLPLLLPVCIILLLTGEHEVFYFQERVGYKGRPFRIWKFATMLKNSPSIGNKTITVRNDPRVLPIGRFLRKTKINELPQLVNVLIGNMSIVGPRPLAREGYDFYPKGIKEKVYDSKPGITGIGSVIFRDEEKLTTYSKIPPRELYINHIAPYKGSLELWYQKHISFITDCKLIFLTAWVIISPSSNLPYRIFNDLPERPKELAV